MTGSAFAWTAQQDDLIDRLAGTLPPDEIAERLSAIGPSRTTASVVHRARILGVSLGKRRRVLAWTPSEDALLRDLYGTLATADVASAISERSGTPRTEIAVYGRVQALGLTANGRAWSARVLGETLGVSPDRLRGWLDSGLIASFVRRRPGGSVSYRFVLIAEAERFVREQWRILDADAIADPRLRQIHHLASRGVRGLSSRAVARRLGAPETAVSKLLTDGLIPGAWQIHGVRGGSHAERGRVWRVPETALPTIRRLLAVRREQHEEHAREQLAGARQQYRQARAEERNKPLADRLHGACRNGHPRTLETTALRGDGWLQCQVCAGARRSPRSATAHGIGFRGPLRFHLRVIDRVEAIRRLRVG